jgi:hypothetical protein
MLSLGEKVTDDDINEMMKFFIMVLLLNIFLTETFYLERQIKMEMVKWTITNLSRCWFPSRFILNMYIFKYCLCFLKSKTSELFLLKILIFICLYNIFKFFFFFFSILMKEF